MLTDKQLIDLQVRALFTHDADSRLLPVNEPGGEAPAPRLFIGRTRDGNIWRFRADLPHALVDELEHLCSNEPVHAEFRDAPRYLDEYVRLLNAHAPVSRREMGPVYHFTELSEPVGRLLVVTEANTDVLKGGFEDLMAELPGWQPFVAFVEEGRAVSVCRSVRITPQAHEAGVETLPDFRGKGYAKEVSAEWARLVQSLGAVPLYSTSWENTASQSVARKLNLRLFGVDFHAT